MLKQRIKKGFTLVELVIVIAVVAILSAVAVGAYFGITESAKNSKLETEAKALHKNITLVCAENQDNHKLNENGLSVIDIDVFEKALRNLSGINVDVVAETPDTIYGPTIALNQESLVSGSVGAPVVYKTFDYLTSDIHLVKGTISLLDGTYSKQSATFTVKEAITDVTKLRNAVDKANEASDEEIEATYIRIGGNIEIDDDLTFNNKNVLLDLNGYTLSGKYVDGLVGDDGNTYNDLIVLHVINGSKLEITGNGVVTYSPMNDEDSAEIRCSLVGCYPGSTVTINNGIFTSSGIKGTAVLYAKNTGKINVTGGTFIGAEHDNYNTYYTLNIKHDSGVVNKANFYVTGGTFYHNNPADWTHEGIEYNYVPEGYVSIPSIISGANVYTVKKSAL